MQRNVVLTGGHTHPFATSAPALGSLLAEHGIESIVEFDPEAAIAQVAKLRPALLTVYALRWTMRQDGKYAPFRGSVRTEDIACQATQPLLDQRREQLATSDKGVILLRKIILSAIRTVQENGTPKGVLPARRAEELIHIDSFTGVRSTEAS